ncbi:MAG: hypothetical protein AB7F75_12320 [Planctomycetota bacterium]
MLVRWLAEHPILSTLLGVMLGSLLWILVKSVVRAPLVGARQEGHHTKKNNYTQRVWDEWKEFGELLGEIVWWIIAGSAFLVIGGLIWIFVLRRQDLLGKKREGNSFWETPKPLEFSLRRHVRQY